MAATLAAAGLPLSAAQLARLQSLAEAAIESESRLRASHGDDVPLLRRVWDEADGRGRFLEASFAALDGEQQRSLRPESIRGRVQADLFSEGLQWGLSLRPVYHRGPESLVAAMTHRLGTELDLDPDTRARVRAVVSDWTGRLPPAVLDVRGDGLEKSAFGEFAGAKLGIAATLELFERLLREVDFSADQRKRLIEYDKVPVPHSTLPAQR
jgi:hypothetical protein